MGYSVSWYERIAMGMSGDAINNFELLIAFPMLIRFWIDIHDDRKQMISMDSSYKQDRALLCSVVSAVATGCCFSYTSERLSSVLTLALSLSRVYVDQRRRLAILWELGYPLRTL
jgi:hypothetical protein